MRGFRGLLAAIVAVVLVACLVAAYVTRDVRSNRTAARESTAANSDSPIDGRLLQGAQQLNAVADTAEEQAFSRDALRLTDRELDLAFASALREATALSVPVSGPFKELADRAARWKKQIAVDQERVAKLSKQADSDGAAAGQLALAKAQLELDRDELEDAQQDLARQGGDQHEKLQRLLQEHEAAEHQAAQTARAPTPGPTTTLSQQAGAWLSLRDRQRQLEANRIQAVNHASALRKEHDVLDESAAGKSAPGPGANSTAATGNSSASAGPDRENTAFMVARLGRLADQRRSLVDLDKRIQDTDQLAEAYTKWSALVAARRGSVLHLLLNSMGVVFAILLSAILIDSAIRRAFGRQTDARRLYQLRVISTIAVQVVAALLILLVIVGPPSQLSTVIGLATAGLTVALKDFIVAFLGWFALMGRNGIRIGDWVEIEGVGGEVVEIGILKTVLLEVGDSGNTGRPTGRRVSFVNNFAIEGHYFNFSTAGQWLWDQLQVALPAAGDPYQLTQQIRDIVEHATEADASEAEKDWERVTHQYGTRPFSAKPVTDLQPGASGLDVVVRYITRAPQRQDVKSGLFKAIVELLHKSSGDAPEPHQRVS
jgi:small-conductance mechanosensitive channel